MSQKIPCMFINSSAKITTIHGRTTETEEFIPVEAEVIWPGTQQNMQLTMERIGPIFAHWSPVSGKLSPVHVYSLWRQPGSVFVSRLCHERRLLHTTFTPT